MFIIMTMEVGVWRSLVARTLGVGEVAGSNPVTPTIFQKAVLDQSFWTLDYTVKRRLQGLVAVRPKNIAQIYILRSRQNTVV